MEQFSNIAQAGPVWPGDLISKADTRRLRNAKLVKYDSAGVRLSWRGKIVWFFWRRIGQAK